MAEAASEPKRILVAEDNLADVYLVREALTVAQIHYSVDVVDDGVKAIELLKQIDSNPQLHLPDLVLMDLNLPGADGLAILAYLRTSLRCSSLPVVVMTSADLTPADEAALGPGLRAYFRKPVHLDEFLKLGQLVRTLLENGKASK